MSRSCEQVEPFVDGELPPEEAEAFRQHLPDCPKCQQALTTLVQLKALSREHFERAAERGGEDVPTARRHAFPWRQVMVPVAASLATAALVAVVMVRGGHSSATSPRGHQDALLTVLQAPRVHEARLSLAVADEYRSLASKPMSAGGATSTSRSFRSEMAVIEAQGQPEEVLAALITQGDSNDYEEMAERLKSAPSSPERANDWAAVFLLKREYGKALGAADAALAERPDMAQAHWNRGLALRGLHLPLLAALAFSKVAALQEPGWADEARQKAETLRREVSSRHQRWQTAQDEGRALRNGQLPSRPDDFVLAPSARLYFYDAVRFSTRGEQVKSLKALAQRLDGLDGDPDVTVLQDYVERISRRDFARRAPLAKLYRKLLVTPEKDLSKEEQVSIVSTLLKSDEDDLALGALVLVGTEPRWQEQLKERVAAGNDPWFKLTTAWMRAASVMRPEANAPPPIRDEQADSKDRGTVVALVQAQEPCALRSMSYRCVQLEIGLSFFYTNLHDFDAARAHAVRGLEQARVLGEWYLERDLLLNLAQIARMVNDASLARAYYQEVLEREPDNVDIQRRVHQSLADVAWHEMRTEEARREIDAALATNLPLSASGAFTLSDVARLARKSGDKEKLERVVSELPATNPERRVAEHALARFTIEFDALQGRGLLRELLQRVNGPAGQGEPTAKRVRAYSFTSLIFEAGHRAAFEEAMGLMQEERGTSLPSRCLLAVTVDSERTLLLVRGAQGELSGRYDDSRRQPLPPGLESLVPRDEAFLAPLRACSQVEVLARPPLHGRTGLLPAGFAWSYLTRASPERRLPPPGRARHLVVYDVELTPHPLAKQLNPWTPGVGSDEEFIPLTGTAATPSGVLAAMKDVSEIDLVTHGDINSFSSASYLLFASEPGGPELRMSAIRASMLQGSPFVILAACKAAHTTYAVHEPLSLPAAFFAAGARGVLAATETIPDAEANAFFNQIREKMRGGTLPAIALRDVREEWRSQGRGLTWLDSVVLFE